MALTSLLFPILLTLKVSICLASTHGMSITVEAGFLVNDDGSQGNFVGNYTSALQSLIDAEYPPITNDDIASITFFNSSELRYLNLGGNNAVYFADITLRLPSMFVLRLDASATMALAPNVSASTDEYPALVALYSTQFSAVVGGTFDARADSEYETIHIEDGTHNKVSEVTCYGNAKQVIHLRNGNSNEIANSTFDGGDLANRCIWCIATFRALVHDNVARHCYGHVIDFDAYTSNSAAWSNLCEENGATGVGEGIFVEETATSNFIFNNTVRNNGGAGIQLYSDVVGPVTNNIVAANRLEGNAGHGLMSGGLGGSGSLHSSSNIIVGNVASNNGLEDYNVLHGSAEGDYWTGNLGTYMYSNDPQSSANVSVFEP